MKKANWYLFKQLSKISIDVNEFLTVDDAIDFLNTTYYSAGYQSIPRTSGNSRQQPVPQWSLKCKLAHKALGQPKHAKRDKDVTIKLLKPRKQGHILDMK